MLIVLIYVHVWNVTYAYQNFLMIVGLKVEDN